MSDTERDRTGADVDEQTKHAVLQDAVNAALERTKKVSMSYSLPHGSSVIRKDEE